jgi:hypothetical protein
MIQLKYKFEEHPQSTLSVFLKTQSQIDAFKQKHPNYIYLTQNTISYHEKH